MSEAKILLWEVSPLPISIELLICLLACLLACLLETSDLEARHPIVRRLFFLFLMR